MVQYNRQTIQSNNDEMLFDRSPFNNKSSEQNWRFSKVLIFMSIVFPLNIYPKYNEC